MKELEDEKDVKDILKSSKPVAIFFYMTGCPHCEGMHEPWEKLEKKHGGSIDFAKVESDNVPDELRSEISGFPHFELVKDGSRLKKLDGSMSGDDLEKKLLTTGGRRSRRTIRGRRKSRRTARRKMRLR